MSVTDDSTARAVRARARRQSLVGALVEPADDRPPVGRTVQERLEMMADVSRRAWALSGRPLPVYARSEMPGQVFRRAPAK